MANIFAHTFPGVYSQVIDESFIEPVTARFKMGLVGPATKGPFNTPTLVRSLQDFIATFGAPPDTNCYMGNAVQLTSPFTDGVYITRVGNEYEDVAITGVTGYQGKNLVSLKSSVNWSQVNMVDPTTLGKSAVYLNIQGSGLIKSSPGMQVASVNSTTGTIVFGADLLSDSYTTDADVGMSYYSNAACKAETILYGYDYGSALPTTGTFTTATKGQYSFVLDTEADAALISAGDLLILDKSGNETQEVMVADKVPWNGTQATITLVSSNNSEIGYQSLPLQYSYTSNNVHVHKATRNTTVKAVKLCAINEGTWANTTDSTYATGLFVSISPGSQANTKKVQVYLNSALVETFDNLANTAPSWNTTIGTATTPVSDYIYVATDGYSTVPANTAKGWNEDGTPYGQTMPDKNINAGGTTGGSFSGGGDGLNPDADDYIGELDQNQDQLTGIKAYETADDLGLTVIAAPDTENFTTDADKIRVWQQLKDTSKAINAAAMVSVPKDIPATGAIDFLNAEGAYTGIGKIDDAWITAFWNAITITDFQTQTDIEVPAVLGALRALAFSAYRYQPWSAAAGTTRGVIPEASAVQYTKLRQDVKDAMYGNGNSVNPIILDRGDIMVWGDRTLQRTESKLTALHNVILVNYIIRNLSDIGRRFVFEPNDDELADQVRLSFTTFLDKVQNGRGIEQYQLTIDNSAENRNRRQMVVTLAVVPTDVMERLLLTAIVKESGAELVGVS